MNKKTLRDVDVANKRVLVRVDFNVPITKDGKVLDDFRILSVLPTINYLREKNAKVILMSHLGRPKGRDESLKMDPVAKALEELAGFKVYKLDDCIGDEVKKFIDENLKPGEVVLLENLRFYKGEEDNDPEFAKALASLGDIFVNDAFATAHRVAASTVGITQYLPAVAGILMEKEIATLSKLLESPEHPYIAVLGGAKVSDKIGLIKNLLNKVDEILIGGGMCFTFLKVQGYNIGRSLCEDDKLDVAKNLLEEAKLKGVKIVLPVDIVTAHEVKEDGYAGVFDIEDMKNDLIGVDIGPKTIKLFENELAKAKTIVWNGPLGVFEIEKFAQGTFEIAKFIGGLDGVTTVAGGGETVAAFRKFNLQDKITHLSTGGGAFLEFLEGKVLPAVDALNDKE
ncbi:MAG: phosphoglycerate kinase [Caldisericum sp.]|uniref:phosphoglycerate kinase n=1 Tax=Caldisericum sp. TaxID=2499687 RepID=UPI003D1314FE